MTGQTPPIHEATIHEATIHEALWICPVAGEPIANGAMAIQGGRIAHVGTQAELRDLPGVRVRHRGAAAIIPGFVNAHTHIELTILRGFLGDVDFTDWIRRLVRVKYQHMDREAFAVSARLGAIENLRAGVTAIGDAMDIGTAWEAALEYGLQGVFYQEVFGPDESVWSESLRGLREKVARYRSSQTATFRIGISPHAPYTVSETLYREAGAWAREEDLPVAVHIAESREETAFVRDGGGPFADALRARQIAVTARGRNPVAYLDHLGLLRPGALLIHAIEIDRAEIERIRSAGAAVAHCPKSNALLGHGVAPVGDLKQSGIPVGLGSDSVASNNVVDMFEEMRAAVFHQRLRAGRVDALSARDAFRMATLGGAQCLGLDASLGSLESGKRADFAVVDLGDLATQPVYDPVETMVYSACRANVRATFLGGMAFNREGSDLVRQAQDIAELLRRSR
ncbi:MAG TPA: amidohydrolase family protein [Terriglobia bacterium]|nr:amidohydrolase family protein [Terriglobia bacterium]